jgi:hypothetical protein
MQWRHRTFWRWFFPICWFVFIFANIHKDIQLLCERIYLEYLIFSVNHSQTCHDIQLVAFLALILGSVLFYYGD